MNAVARILWLVLLALTQAWPGLANATDRTAPLVFSLPRGWTNLSVGAPDKNFAGLSPAVRAQSRAVSLLAMDLAGAKDGFAENLNVRMVKCPGPYDESVMRELLKSLQRNAAPGLRQLKVLEHKLVQVQGVMGARFVLHTIMQQGGRELDLKQVQYHLPAGERCGIATYTASRSSFSRYEALFDASALATTGLVEPPNRGFFYRVGRSAGRGAAIGLAIGLLVALFMALRKRLSR